MAVVDTTVEAASSSQWVDGEVEDLPGVEDSQEAAGSPVVVASPVVVEPAEAGKVIDNFITFVEIPDDVIFFDIHLISN